MGQTPYDPEAEARVLARVLACKVPTLVFERTFRRITAQTP